MRFLVLILIVWFGVVAKEVLPEDAVGGTKKEQDIVDASIQWAYQNGLFKKTGIAIAKDALIIGRAMLESGAVTLEQMERDTKGGGVDEYGLFVEQRMWESTKAPACKLMLAALSQRGEGETFVLDESLYKRVADREIGILELWDIAYGKLRNDPILAGLAQRQPLRIREAILVGHTQWFKASSSYMEIMEDGLVGGIITEYTLSHLGDLVEEACGRK